jgi:hypothetical protein
VPSKYFEYCEHFLFFTSSLQYHHANFNPRQCPHHLNEPPLKYRTHMDLTCVRDPSNPWVEAGTRESAPRLAKQLKPKGLREKARYPAGELRAAQDLANLHGTKTGELTSLSLYKCYLLEVTGLFAVDSIVLQNPRLSRSINTVLYYLEETSSPMHNIMLQYPRQHIFIHLVHVLWSNVPCENTVVLPAWYCAKTKTFDMQPDWFILGDTLWSPSSLPHMPH